MRLISESLLSALRRLNKGDEKLVPLSDMDKAVDQVIAPMIMSKLRAEAKNEILLNAFSRLREIACNFAPAVAHSQGFEPLRKLMANRATMERAIDDVLAKR